MLFEFVPHFWWVYFNSFEFCGDICRMGGGLVGETAITFQHYSINNKDTRDVGHRKKLFLKGLLVENIQWLFFNFMLGILRKPFPENTLQEQNFTHSFWCPTALNPTYGFELHALSTGTDKYECLYFSISVSANWKTQIVVVGEKT